MRGYAWTRLSTAARHGGRHITDERQGGPPDDAFWGVVAARVLLTEEQEDALTAAFDLRMGELRALRGRQAGVAARLRELLQEGYRGLTFDREERRRSEMAELAAELERSLEAENEIWLMVYMGMVALLPPLAIARMLVACFPYWPDGPGIMRALQRRVAASREARGAAPS
ncbi:hypothetical protein MNEG_12167 [Monoraphidium neglectum]|uniref:Uncharacterized protein n=1 Tax=Monoraphidium neglectum TaxID=145388 RepID=A0A0D2KIZ4_9CHLO|nr:hypothetical protein MNEG_12167 [Monoraphidium neglectum]KIY95793.1 hypothetical protein MNEG_12167 [Monoraphidium neglectum]|eukprot:XP_013894813.1 hypothetical protein MNEG_12167 [Monoraphidium neglectum]